jgi:cytochrome c-type biogenesis protein CcmH
MTESKAKSSLIAKFALGAGVAALAGALIYSATRDGGASESAASAVATAGPAGTIETLEARTKKDPRDVEAWQLLGWSYFDAGRYSDAANAYREATALSPDRGVLWSSLGEAIVMASERDPMPREAADAFEKAASLDPKDPRARYFNAVRRDLSGDHKGAIDDWVALLRETPQGAPWETDLKRTIEQVGKINKIETAAVVASADAARATLKAPAGSVAAAAIPGPTRQQMSEAAQLPPGQQQAMVEGMVASLEGKLKANPANVDGWIMLMRSRMTLGETAKASAAFQSAVAANPSARARLTSEAKLLGVPGA